MSEAPTERPWGVRFGAALDYAARLHHQQTRKGKPTPYIAHLLTVAGFAIESGADEDEAIAALLHDAVEDQGGEETRVEIERRFGSRVSSLVMALSDSVVDTREGEEKEPWRVRKERYVAHLAQADASVQLLAACDKLHNLRDLVEDYRLLGNSVWDRFNAGLQDQLWFYRSVVDCLTHGQEGIVFRRLRAALADFEAAVDEVSSRD